jgi:hypothetical protein
MLGLTIVAGVIVALVLITSSGGTNKTLAGSQTPTTNAPGAHPGTRRAAFTPANVTVAVLNGTATAGLAHRVSQNLSALGYRPGSVVTAPDQTRTATVVAYLPGYRDDALHVARALKLGSASVQPVDPATKAVACPPPTTCTANVVVTVGADLATTA